MLKFECSNVQSMATIKYLLQSKGENVPIYLRLSLNQSKSIKRKTGFNINSNNWSSATGLPKQNNTAYNDLTTDLRELTKEILKNLNVSNSLGVEINGDWLNLNINKVFNRVEVNELEYLTNYGDQFLKELKYKVSGNKKGVSNSTEKKYTTIVNKLKAFETYSKKRFKIIDVDLHFRTKFIEYMNTVDKLSENTIGRYLKIVKTICLDAERNGFTINKQLQHFKGFTVKAPKITLSFDELELIKKADLINENHKITRDWLIIGCYTGQRVSDLLRMNSGFIEQIHDFEFIVLEQVKTGKLVQIPVHDEVKKILDKRNGEFPPLLNKNIEITAVMFNRYLKKVCEIAEIDTIVEGNAFNDKTKRTVKGNYEKHLLVSSHICRRSFATNFYSNRKYPTPLLMNITAHSTEKMFLEYIGKKPIDYGLQLAEIWLNESVKKNTETAKMEVVKNVANS